VTVKLKLEKFQNYFSEEKYFTNAANIMLFSSIVICLVLLIGTILGGGVSNNTVGGSSFQFWHLFYGT
jgi:ABC-type sugar transport system permease subunit